MPQTNLDLAELRRLVDAMSKAPWEVRQGGNFTDFGAPGFKKYCDEHSDSATDLKLGDTNVRLGNRLLKRSRSDAAAIAALRNAAPALLAIAEAAREFIDAYDIGHEEEHMFVDALRKALGGKR